MASPLSFIRAGTGAERALLTIARRSSQRRFSSTTASHSPLQKVRLHEGRPAPAYGSSLGKGIVLQQRNAFSTSQARRATITTLNPREDEEGQEMKIEITDRAAKVRPRILYSRRRKETSLTFAASTGHRCQRQEPRYCAPGPGRVGRVPWLSIPYVAHEQEGIRSPRRHGV